MAGSGSASGLVRLVVALALLLPLGVAVMVLGQLTGTSLASPTSLSRSDGGSGGGLAKRPIVSDAAPPPTLVPAATPTPSATPVPAVAATAQPTAEIQLTPTAQAKGATYTVRPGDELKHIAAIYHVSIWQIIATNDIPNPDSLRIGQVLRIPDQ